MRADEVEVMAAPIRLALEQNAQDRQRLEIALDHVLALSGEPTVRGLPRGTMPLRTAVLEILQEAAGEIVTAGALWDIAQRRGVRTQSATPVKVVGSTIINLRRDGYPIEKISPSRWRWGATSRASSTAPEGGTG